jgi:hypothetical protein
MADSGQLQSAAKAACRRDSLLEQLERGDQALPLGGERERERGGTGHRHRLGPDHRPATRTLTSEKPPLRHRRSKPGAPGTPGRRPAGRATVIPRR